MQTLFERSRQVLAPPAALPALRKAASTALLHIQSLKKMPLAPAKTPSEAAVRPAIADEDFGQRLQDVTVCA